MENPLGHPVDCTCERCEDWRDAQLGLDLLKRLKAVKASVRSDDKVSCPNCENLFPAGSNFCPHCGKKQH